MGTNNLVTERQLRPLTNLKSYQLVTFQQSQRLIQSFEVINNIRPIGRIPQNLEQTRYLAQLDPDLLRIDIVKSVTLFRLIV